jgi:hypothetical protein
LKFLPLSDTREKNWSAMGQYMLYYHCFTNFALKYAIRKVRENQLGLKLNGMHQLLAYGYDVNLLGDNIDTAKKNTETLIEAGKEFGLELSIEKTTYKLLSRHHNAGKNRHLKITDRLFENESEFNIWDRQ